MLGNGFIVKAPAEFNENVLIEFEEIVQEKEYSKSSNINDNFIRNDLEDIQNTLEDIESNIEWIRTFLENSDFDTDLTDILDSIDILIGKNNIN